MNTEDILHLIFERHDTLQGYWNLFIAGTAAILGLVASGKPFAQQKQMKAFLSAAFVIFALSNLAAILNLNSQRRELAKLIEEPKVMQLIESTLPPPDSWLIAFHLTIDVIVVFTIWFVQWHGLASSKK